MGFNVAVNDDDGRGRTFAEYTGGICLEKAPSEFAPLVLAP